MTTHILQPDQIVIQPDRRREQKPFFYAEMRLNKDGCKKYHNYSKPQRIAYVKMSERFDRDVNIDKPTYSPDDLLVVAEEWACTICSDYVRTVELVGYPPDWDINPPLINAT